MNLDPGQVAEAALRLHEAERNRVQIRSMSFQYPDMDLDDAYAIQQAWIELKLAEGREIKGRKIGLTSKAMQQVMQIDEPDFGTLLDNMFFDNRATIEAAQFTDPRIEVELAFVLKRALTGNDTSVEAVLAATECVIPAVELIAARTHRIDPETSKPRGILDTISDNAANAGIILADTRYAPEDLDLCWVSAVLERNGEIEESGVSAAVLGHPARGIGWLGHKFSEHGIALEPGEVILSGSFTRPVAINSGDGFCIEFSTACRIECNFF